MCRARGHLGNSYQSILIAVAISIVGFLFSLDTGIMASTMAHDSYQLYTYGETMQNSASQGGIVGAYYVGLTIGSAASAWTMDS